jgi:hypothetical protein
LAQKKFFTNLPPPLVLHQRIGYNQHINPAARRTVVIGVVSTAVFFEILVSADDRFPSPPVIQRHVVVAEDDP